MRSCLICDDHPLLCAAIGAVVRGQHPDVRILEAGDFPTAWRLAAEQPDLCITDLMMPGATPLEGIDGLRAAAPEMRLLVLTGSADDDLLLAVLARGVHGFAQKSAAPGVIAAAVGLVLAGGRYLPPNLADFVVPGSPRAAPPAPAPGPVAQGDFGRLTERQLEILKLVAAGQSNKDIARALDLSPATVKSHVAQTLASLGAANRTEAAAKARQRGLL